MRSTLKSLTLFCVLFIALTSPGCSKTDSLQKKYGQNTNYFTGLKDLQKKNISDARRHLKKSAEKGIPLIQEYSLRKLSEAGSVDQKISSAQNLYSRFPSEENLTLMCRILSTHYEYAKVINFTSGIKIESADNELIYYRLLALQKKNNPAFTKEYSLWCKTRPFTEYHYKVFCELKDPDDLSTFRANVYNKKYTLAFETAKSILTNSENLTSSILSDAGKALLYGSQNFAANAQYLDSLAQEADDENKYYLYFYSGRLYDRAPNYRSKALSKFMNAMTLAPSAEKYDNALWYYLNTTLKNSTTSAIDAVKTYSSAWNDPNYFDDFFDTLSVQLISQHMWKDFYRLTKILSTTASNETAAKYAYISARLIEENYITVTDKNSWEETQALYQRALNSDTDLYYKLLAAKKLEYTQEQINSLLQSTGKKTEITRDAQAELLLKGYADFGLAEYIYSDWLILRDKISLDCAQDIALFLQKCGNSSNTYYTQSLRIAARKANYPENKLYPQLLALTFPQNFKDQVESACKSFNQNEYLLYALIRSESFFNPTVKSHAGAIGLTQLMETTASDVARKLKIAEYNLMNPETNIKFGSYYLEEMIRRLDDSQILAIFAYNGGITRVRQWVKSADLEFGTKNLAKDLFLEALPFSETREYGRKVVSAAALYGTLYYNKTTSQVIAEIMD